MVRALPAPPAQSPRALRRAPIHYAAMNNKLDIINLLIKNHNDLHQPTGGGRDDTGRTALHIAALHGQRPRARFARGWTAHSAGRARR
jgi:ankyrin repeat protein